MPHNERDLLAPFIEKVAIWKSSLKKPALHQTDLSYPPPGFDIKPFGKDPKRSRGRGFVKVNALSGVDWWHIMLN